MWDEYNSAVDLELSSGHKRRRVKAMIERLKRKYALSDKGAKNLIKAGLACTLQNIACMLPIGLIYL